MNTLIDDLIPHAPQMGLYVVPHIPEKLLRNAHHDYAGALPVEEVLALFDATLMGSGKDGAVFGVRRFVFQNNDLEHTHDVRYEDLVRVDKRRGLFKGAKIDLSINRGRATFDVTLDCSGKPKAMEFLYRFLHEAMLQPIVQPGEEEAATVTDREAVLRALDALRAAGQLAEADYHRLVAALNA